MISRFAVKNYKCLQDVDIPLTPIHVLIGQNDSGKTSLLEAMLALSMTTERPLKECFLPGEWSGRELVFEGADKPIIQFVAQLDDTKDQESPRITYNLEIEFIDTLEKCRRTDEWSQDEQNHPVPARSWDRTGISTRSYLQAGKEKDHLEKIAERLGPAVLYRFNPRIMAVPATIDPFRKFRMDSDGFGLATLLDDITGYDPERFLVLRDDFCKFFPQFRKVGIRTEVATNRQFNPTGRHTTTTGNGKGIFFETKHGQTIQAQQASDGAILFLALLALIHSPKPPKLLLIEEPEKGVYPKRLEQVIGLLRRLQESPGDREVPQIIMTTHSPFLLSLFEPEEVTFMVREGADGSGPVRARPLRDAPNIRERLGDGEFYLGELWYNLTEEELFTDARP